MQTNRYGTLWITVSEYAERMHINRSTAYRYIQKLPETRKRWERGPGGNILLGNIDYLPRYPKKRGNPNFFDSVYQSTLRSRR